ncbi:MAG: glycosyltransferase [Bacteroidota bacterium]
MKTILYISYDGMTDQLGQSQVIPYLIALAKAGYRFHLLSVEKKQKLKKTGEQIRSLLKEAGIEWTTLTFTRRPPLLSKLFDQWKLNAKAASLCRNEKITMVHCRSYVPAAAGLKLSKRFGIPFLFDMRGFWVDERVDSGLWKQENPFYRFLYKLYKKKERKYFSAAAHIISLTHKGKEELVSAYKVPPGRISVIPCCADMDHFDYRKISEQQKTAVKKQLNIRGSDKVISYLGSLGGWYLTEEMLDFFAAMKKQIQDSVFLLITHDNRELVLARAVKKGIAANDIRVQPATRNEVPQFLSVSEWNIFFIKDAYSKKASSPTKQGEVMAMGIPVLCNDIGDTGKIVEESAAGILVKKFDAEEYEKICRQLAGPSRWDKEQIRQSAIKYFDLVQGVTVYKEVYARLLN